MHYVSAEGLTKSFGAEPLFRNISFNISEGDKIALIARNGFGKSTLLKILAGKETVDEGKLWVHKDVTVALFEQNPQFHEEKTALENIFHGEHPVMVAIKAYEEAVDTGDAGALSKALIKVDELNAWDFESKVKQILGKLNIHDLNTEVRELSGGQRKRIALARTLIDIGFDHTHTFLIMDEPTNHLDIDMVEWLEYYLNKENVTLLLVTHDRYFLDAVVDEIWEIDNGKIYSYKGDYENYLEKKAARLENEQANIDKAQNLYRHELEWIRKQPRARTTKSKSRIDAFAETEQKAKQKIQDAQLNISVKMSRLGGKIAEMKKVYKNYGEKIILKGFDYTFNKGERIGIIGKNGTGKTTFINILQGLEKPDSGKINVGDTIVFGNFSQQGLDAKEDMRLIEYVKTFAESFPLAKGGSLSASQFLELFLFPPEKQYTYLSALSGGEKKRLQLLTILFRNPNFLILDEPTNDLDLPTLNVLENFLADFPGCIIIVSHDRYFMDKLVDHLFVFEGNGVIKDFPGNYTQYRLEEKSVESLQMTDDSKQVNESANSQQSTVNSQQSSVNRKLSYKEKREFEQLEKDIADLEAEKQSIEEQLSNPEAPFEKLNLLSHRINAITNELHQKEMRWLELSELA
ncbi:MAG TPA: ABC-F family ATP-binding cassette domain-containing protein [Parafilimonas sp.]|nr:ABC-F family ATP-binding cassette domain-containing protein [Parafilimonas sp.]